MKTEFKGTKEKLYTPCGTVSGTPQSRPNNVIYESGTLLIAKVYGGTVEEAAANTMLFKNSFHLLEALSDIVNQIDNEHVSEYLIEMKENAEALIKATIEL